MNNEIKVMNNDEIRDFCIKKDLKIFELEQEIERLNNIINELEKYIIIKLKEFNSPEEFYTLKQIENIHYRLEELKGSDKE